MADGRLRIVTLGYVVRGPLAGHTWHHLQYALGLQQLGHDVYFLEDSDDFESCYDPVLGEMTADPGYGLAFVQRTFERVGLGERWAYFDAHAGSWHGPAASRVPELCRTADLLLNVSGVNPLREWFEAIPHRALVDTDPAFTQIRHLTDPAARARAERHTVFFTFGENVESGAMPDDGLPWQPTRQPVVLSAWPAQPPPTGGAYTNVMQWASYPPREFRGVRYGLKSDSFGPYLDLPGRTEVPLELGVGGPPDGRELLARHGWRVFDPLEMTMDPWRYQAYIAASRAEFAIAKHGYVVSRCGWFSERTAGYLATGRPSVTQDTGFASWLPTGRGVIPFSSPEEALAGIADVDARYELHQRAARELAEQYFDSDRVLAHLIERALAGPATERVEHVEHAGSTAATGRSQAGRRDGA